MLMGRRHDTFLIIHACLHEGLKKTGFHVLDFYPMSSDGYLIVEACDWKLIVHQVWGISSDAL